MLSFTASADSRIIPTSVGTSCACYYSWTIIGDHPHACGDKSASTTLKNPIVGSSPRVWGQGLFSAGIVGVGRIIPTRVGTSCYSRKSYQRIKDHPHAYGDKPCKDPAKSAMIGSSPRVWGQVSACVIFIIKLGIIPTRVGTSCWCLFSSVLGEDHPHACGDKPVAKQTRQTRRGSSPRVWGQALYYAPLPSKLRIIPTRVGTSLFEHGERVCVVGSSPLVWGQVFIHFISPPLTRIIPTRMGTSLFMDKWFTSS